MKFTFGDMLQVLEVLLPIATVLAAWKFIELLRMAFHYIAQHL